MTENFFNEDGTKEKEIIHKFNGSTNTMTANFYDATGKGIFESHNFNYDINTSTYDFQHADTWMRNENVFFRVYAAEWE